MEEKMDKTKVLVIDDEQGIRDLFIQALGEDDYEVLTVESGEQGLDIIKNEKPHITFLDLKLPGIDGLEVLKRISDLESKPIVIMITGHGTIAKAAKTMDLGAYDYIVKPFQIDDIIKLMPIQTATPNKNQPLALSAFLKTFVIEFHHFFSYCYFTIFIVI